MFVTVLLTPAPPAVDHPFATETTTAATETTSGVKPSNTGSLWKLFVDAAFRNFFSSCPVIAAMLFFANFPWRRKAIVTFVGTVVGGWRSLRSSCRNDPVAFSPPAVAFFPAEAAGRAWSKLPAVATCGTVTA